MYLIISQKWTSQIEFRFCLFRFEFNLYLIVRKMNHQAGILSIITKIQIQQRSKKRLSRSNLVENRNSIWGVCPPRHGLFCVTEASHENLCHVVGWLRGEKPPLWEIGRPEQPQRGLRRSLAQRRPPATLRKQSRPPKTQFFDAQHLENCATNYYMVTSLRSSTAISPSLLPVSGGGVAPAHPRDA